MVLLHYWKVLRTICSLKYYKYPAEFCLCYSLAFSVTKKHLPSKDEQVATVPSCLIRFHYNTLWNFYAAGGVKLVLSYRSQNLYHPFFFFLGLYLFSERGEGMKKGREKNINVWLPHECPLLGTWPITQACALTRN